MTDLRKAAEMALEALDYQVNVLVEAAVLAERKRIVNLFMIQHEAAKGAHNYWQVAAYLVQAESGENS